MTEEQFSEMKEKFLNPEAIYFVAVSTPAGDGKMGATVAVQGHAMDLANLIVNVIKSNPEMEPVFEVAIMIGRDDD